MKPQKHPKENFKTNYQHKCVCWGPKETPMHNVALVGICQTVTCANCMEIIYTITLSKENYQNEIQPKLL